MRYSATRYYRWSENIAYLVGLMASDGCLSKDGRHLDITSVDLEQLNNFLVALGRNLKISEKSNQHLRTAYRVQFSDVALYDFLTEVGLTPNKSKTIGTLKIPDMFYPDFLRGLFDGDGSVYAFWDKRWKSSYMYYTNISSASLEFIIYLRMKNSKLCSVGEGTIKRSYSTYTLGYAKKDSDIIYDFMYYSMDVLSLTRKRRKLEQFIEINKANNLIARVA